MSRYKLFCYFFLILCCFVPIFSTNADVTNSIHYGTDNYSSVSIYATTTSLEYEGGEQVISFQLSVRLGICVTQGTLTAYVKLGDHFTTVLYGSYNTDDVKYREVTVGFQEEWGAVSLMVRIVFAEFGNDPFCAYTVYNTYYGGWETLFSFKNPTVIPGEIIVPVGIVLGLTGVYLRTYSRWAKNLKPPQKKKSSIVKGKIKVDRLGRVELQEDQDNE
ncbi:MAG: hypothetical protein GPJ51_12490 [Candidatus Heimdallarchaeota archaeon]|nr:hypothetical protein [Candidatus Heimdallarchaeota archaeon]